MDGFWDNDNPRTTNLPNPLIALPEDLLAEHLGKVSNFVGLMDTAEQVQAHLDAVQLYQTVRESLLPDTAPTTVVTAQPGEVKEADTLFKAGAVELARKAWKDAVAARKEALAEHDENVRRLHAAFTAIKNG